MLRITVNAKIFLPDAVFSRLGEKSDYRKNHGRAREGRSPLALKSSPAACTAGTGRFLRRKIPFSRAKIVSLQFPRPEIRRILAETGGGARRPRAVRETGRSKPNEQGSIASRQAQQDDHCELWMWQWRGAHEARALWAKQREVSPMRAKEAAQPVAAIAADEPSEAGSAASELANDAERPC